MKYDAFISYRHAELDMETAKRLHTALETYHVPGAVRKKTGKKRINRVFRDQEELPIGSDLDENILSALKESEYLIVVCSPRTPESFWVCKEIESFIKLRDRNHVLAILIEGEPSDSFPALLLSDDNGNPVEPLAADVRGNTPAERKKRFKSEFLRLAAPVIGCSYDDLRQRHRERKIRRLALTGLAVGAAAAVCGAAFGIYNARVARNMEKLAGEKAELADEKTVLADEMSKLADDMSKLADEKSLLAEEKTELANNILKQYNEKLENQSRLYAEKSLRLLEEGNRQAAVQTAAAALPSEGNERPYVGEAEYALSQALYAYNNGKYLDYDRMLSLSLATETMRLSRDEKYLTVVDKGYNTYVYDTGNFDLLAKIKTTVKDNNYLNKTTFADTCDDGVFIAYENRIEKYDANTGELLGSSDYPDTIQCGLLNPEAGEFYVFSGSKMYVLDTKTLEEKQAVAKPKKAGNFGSDCVLSSDGRFIAVTAVGDLLSDEGAGYILFTPEKTKSSYHAASKSYVMEMVFTDEDNLAVVSCDSDFLYGSVDAVILECLDPAKDKLLWSYKLPEHINSSATFSLKMCAHTYSGVKNKSSEIVIALENEFFTVDEKEGSLISTGYLSGNVRALALEKNTPLGYIAYSNGKIEALNFNTGRIDADFIIDTGLSINELTIMIGDHKILFTSVTGADIYVVKNMQAPDLEEITELKSLQSCCASAPSGSCFVTFDYNDACIKYFYDTKGTLLYTFSEAEKLPTAEAFFGDIYIYCCYDCYWLIDPVNASAKKYMHEDLGLEGGVYKNYITRSGKYGVFWKYNKLSVLDFEANTVIFSTETEGDVGNAVISEDAGTILASCTDMNLIKINVSDGTVTKAADDALRAVSDYYILKYLAISPDGSLAAMSCSDGIIRLVDVKGMSEASAPNPSEEELGAGFGKAVTVAKQTRLRSFLYFTEDGKHLVIQGDDLTVNVMDIETGNIISSFTANMEINYCTENDDQLALCDDEYVYLLENKNFVKIAEVYDTICYLAGEKSFIVTDGYRLFKTKYKNYEELLKEAAKQFPEA